MKNRITPEQIDGLLESIGLDTRPVMILTLFRELLEPLTLAEAIPVIKKLGGEYRYPMPVDLAALLGQSNSWQDAWANVEPWLPAGILSSNPQLYKHLSELEACVLRNCGYKIRTAPIGKDRLIFKDEYEAEQSRRRQAEQKRRELEAGDDDPSGEIGP